MAWAIAGGAISGLGQGISEWSRQNWQEKMMQELMQGNFSNNLALQNNYYENQQKLQFNSQQFQKEFLAYKNQMNALNTPSQIFGSAMRNSGSLTSSIPTNSTNVSSPFSPRTIPGITFNSAGQTPTPTISDDGSPRITKGVVTTSRGTGILPTTTGTQVQSSTAPEDYGEEERAPLDESNMALDGNAAINANVRKPGMQKLLENDSIYMPNVPQTGFWQANNVS